MIAIRWGLRDGEVVLQQIAGGRILVRTGLREWWENPRNIVRDWQIFQADEQCHSFDSKAVAEQVIQNLKK